MEGGLWGLLIVYFPSKGRSVHPDSQQRWLQLWPTGQSVLDS